MGLRKKKTLMDHAAEYLEETVIPTIESAVSGAKEAAVPLLADAREKAAPIIADAREKAAPVIADAREKAAEKAAAGAELAAEKAAVAREVAAERAAVVAAAAAEQLSAAREVAAEKAASGRDLAAAKVAEVKGEKPKSHKLRNLLLFGGLLALLGVVAKKFTGGEKTDNWQSSYTPAPPATSRPTPAASAAPATPEEEPTPIADSIRDEAGADPGEALADATDEPHPVTTPDSPAEVVDVDVEGEAEKKK